MRKLLLLAFILYSFQQVSAQAREATQDYLKTQQPAAVIEYPYAEDLVEGALKNQFEKQGAKVSSSKGMMIVKNVSISAGTENQILDLYFKIDRKSRKDKEISVVYLSAGHPGENIAIRASGDRFGVAESIQFLNGLVPVLENYSVSLQVTEQEDVLKKADKKYSGLISDSVDYQKRKLTLEQKIVENSKAQEAQRLDLERQRQILEALKARKKS